VNDSAGATTVMAVSKPAESALLSRTREAVAGRENEEISQGRLQPGDGRRCSGAAGGSQNYSS
jgi:hypothetical protein